MREKLQLLQRNLNKKCIILILGYPGGIKSESFNSLRQRKPEKIIERAVWGMLPKNRLGRAVLKKLHIYPDANHPHQSQNPKELVFNIKKVEENA